MLESAEPGPRLTGKHRVTVGEVKLAPATLGRPGRLEKGLVGLFLETLTPLTCPCSSLAHDPQVWPNFRED